MHLMALGWHFHAFPLITSLQCILGLVGFCERQVMNDHACFSSNPFPDGRLVALNTMSKESWETLLHFAQNCCCKFKIV